MSTPALVNFVQLNYETKEPETVCTVYHHGDGYPSYFGVELARAMPSGNIYNGINGRQNEIEDSNGFGCFIATTIQRLKNERPLGGVYIQTPGRGYGQYVYEVKYVNELLTITVTTNGDELFTGSISELDAFSQQQRLFRGQLAHLTS